jgi:flagellar hook-associated protein 2
MQTAAKKKVEIDLAGVSSATTLIDKLNNSFQQAGLDVVAKQSNGRVSLSTGSKNTSIKVDDSSSEWGLQILGMSKDSASSESKANAQILNGTTSPNFTAGVTFTVTLNGVSKQISVEPKTDANGDITAENVQKVLAESFRQAFGGTIDPTTNNLTGSYVNVTFDQNGEFTISAANSLDQVTITGSSANSLGITPGSSNRISTSTKLGDLTDNVVGGTYKFTINGVNFSFTEEDTLGTMINKINTSGAGVKVAYSSLSDTFTMESSSTGSKYSIDITQQEGNILSELFGDAVIDAGSSVSSSLLTTKTVQGTSDTIADTFTMGKTVSFSINVNGTNHTFTLPAKGDKSNYTAKEAIEDINKQLAETFKMDDDSPAIQIEGNNIVVKDGSVVRFTRSSVDLSNASSVSSAKQNDLAFLLGLNVTNKSNIATAETSIDDLSLSDSEKLGLKQISNDGTLGGGFQNAGITFENGRLVADTTQSNVVSDIDGNDLLKKLFGVEGGSIADKAGNGALGANAVTDGTDALVNVNGIDLTRSSNTFEVNGVTIEVTKKMEPTGTDAAGKPTYESATIKTDRDVDSIVETFKNFVKDYNAMLEKLNGYVDEDANYRKYDPLTSAQKKEMSEREIELWEEKAKEGLLRRDDNIDYFLSQMRIALYTKPESSNYALYDIGMETGKYSDKGKLTFDETALRKALSSDPESVKNLFLDLQSGLSGQLVKIMDDAAKLSSGSPGTLVQEAGAAGLASDKNNNLTNRIKEIEDKIKDLKAKYETERQRYWNQFTSMETTLSNLNSQSNWLYQQFSY